MNKFFTLTKILFKTGGESLIQKDKKKLPKTIALLVLIIIGFLPMAAMFVKMSMEYYSNLAQINQQGLILELGAVASSLIVFIFGIFYVMSTFYFSKDIETLLPLPLKPSVIIGAKFTVVLLYEYLTMLVFFMPILITYGIMSSGGVLYYLYALVIFLTVPVVPLVIVSLIIMIIMRFTPFTKNKDAFNTAAGIFGLLIGVGFNIVFQRLGVSMNKPEQMIHLMMQGDNALVGMSSKVFPQIKIAVNALLYSGELRGFVNLLLFLIITTALVLLLVIFGEILYFKGVIGITETSSKRKKLSNKELEENLVQSSAVKSYMVKELKILFRTPAYFMNCVLMNFLFPVFLFIPFLSQPDLFKELPKLRAFVNSGDLPGYIIAAALGVMMFISVANPTACTAISREGSNIFICKYLPISYKKQLMSKIWSAVLLNFIGLVFLIITVMLVVIPPVYLLLQIVVLGILVALFSAFSGILIDLAFPKLDWDTEQRAVKQNMNVLILMLAGFVIGGAAVFAVVMLELGIWSAFGVLLAVYGLADAVLYWLVSTLGVRMFKKL